MNLHRRTLTDLEHVPYCRLRDFETCACMLTRLDPRPLEHNTLATITGKSAAFVLSMTHGPTR